MRNSKIFGKFLQENIAWTGGGRLKDRIQSMRHSKLLSNRNINKRGAPGTSITYVEHAGFVAEPRLQVIYQKD